MNQIVMMPRRAGKTTMAKHQQALIDALKADGWELDRFGHFQKDVTRVKNRESGETVTKRMRVKMQATSCRIEVQGKVNGQNEWFRVGGAYYSELILLPDGRVRVGTYFVGAKKDPNCKGTEL